MKLNDVNVASQPATPGLSPQQISEEVLLEKYAKGGGISIDDVCRRVASALAPVELPKQRAATGGVFYRAQVDGFIPGGRINSAAGTNLKATLINCFVQPVGDSISDVMERLASMTPLTKPRKPCGAAAESATTFRAFGPRCACQRDREPRQRPAVVHEGVRSVVRDCRVRRRASRGTDGRAPL